MQNFKHSLHQETTKMTLKTKKNLESIWKIFYILSISKGTFNKISKKSINIPITKISKNMRI